MTDAALHIHPTGHDHSACVDDALETAESLCVERGARLTPLRRRVLELVWSSHRPVGAYDILGKLGDGARKPAPPTVYRALDFLIENGLVHRIESMNAYLGCIHPKEFHTGQFLICRECGNVTEMDDDEVRQTLRRKAAAKGFDARSQTVELVGFCANCKAG
ncbi:transcriptional repressor [Emcibacter sp. SYSU 3D8]|uniref:Fur family transcriptional regulator n=1 Tax=Emcibacter sp. SYSU 3D8 TaxID=3133969 RepID=UPI0031FF2206